MTAARLMWFGLLAPAVAFTVFFVAGFVVTQGTCDAAGRGGPSHLAAWTVPMLVLAAAIGAAGEAAAVAAWRRSRDKAAAPPTARIHFMAVMAMTTAPLFTVIVVMAGVGVLVLGSCVQA